MAFRIAAAATSQSTAPPGPAESPFGMGDLDRLARGEAVQVAPSAPAQPAGPIPTPNVVRYAATR